MLTIILAEAELELVPENIKMHPQVQSSARNRDRRASRTLLDSSLHHEAMRGLPESDRRGRPDIVHFALLLALDSALNKADKLRVVVHTRHDERIAIHPDTRLMRHYIRFIGLMESLFRDGGAPRHDPLLVHEPGWTLQRVLEHHATGPIVCFSEKGSPIEPGTWMESKVAQGEDLTIVLGCFPHGDFHQAPESFANEVVGLGGASLSVWTVEAEIIAHYERAVKLFPRPPVAVPEPSQQD